MGTKTTTVCPKGCEVAFSSLSAYFYGPYDNVTALNTTLGATISNGLYDFDCSNINKLPKVLFTIPGKLFPIKPADYVLNVSGTCSSIFLSWSGTIDLWKYFLKILLYDI